MAPTYREEQSIIHKFEKPASTCAAEDLFQLASSTDICGSSVLTVIPLPPLLGTEILRTILLVIEQPQKRPDS
jgi:hypothetical protein